MRSIDGRAVAEFGMPSLLLMENAGRAVAQRAWERLEGRGTVRVLCGKGNNGGDGFVAARHLHNRGLDVACYLAGASADLRGDARANLDLALRLGIPVREEVPDRLDGDLILDALLGTGFRGEPRGAIAELIRRANDCGLPLLAVDVPSGLDADTGQAPGEVVRARETVTFGLPKLGLLSHPGRDLAGESTVAEISLPPPLLQDPGLTVEWITSAQGRELWPARAATAHKGDSGRVFVLAGSPGMTGAATLCCEASLRAGAGLVTLGVPRSLNPILEVKLTEAMTLPLPETEGGSLSSAGLEVVVQRLSASGAGAVGPGFGRDPEGEALVRGVLEAAPCPLVLDADALNLLSPAGPGTFPAACVLTPHPGEMARLLGTTVEAIQSNRIEIARQAAERLGCVVVLKGAATVVAAPDGRLGVNSSGGPALATGGTGDVLTGITAACPARGLAPFEAAVAAVFLHGLAGEVAEERWGAPGAVAGDVAAAIPEAHRRLQTGEVSRPCRMI
jgi:NAD(P)H-hydrate epimerase